MNLSVASSVTITLTRRAACDMWTICFAGTSPTTCAAAASEVCAGGWGVRHCCAWRMHAGIGSACRHRFYMNGSRRRKQ